MVASDDEAGRIARSREGDHDAFESLVRDYQQMVHAVCYRMTGSMADAEDLAQLSFIHAFRGLDRFRGDASFSSWLYRIAMNQCLNWQQSKQRHERLHRQWSEEQTATPASTTAESGQTEAVQAALLKLDSKQRAAIVLTVYEGMNHAQAARAPGCSETTVSWRIFMARKKLKRLLTTNEG